jgi:Putative prokaryotic signal transducing protein
MSDRAVIEVYRARDNLQARLLAQTLNEIGIQAWVEESAHSSRALEGATLWSDAPRILVFADQAELARQILLGWEEQKRQEEARASEGPPIDVVCEKCGKSTFFPASQRGSVQNCSHCNAYVDVGEADLTEELSDFDEADPPNE